MNVYGDVGRFAISVQLYDEHDGHFLTGRYCFHICGEILGSLNHDNYLYILLNDCEYWSCSAGKRQNCYLMSLDALNFVEKLSTGLFGVDPSKPDEYPGDDQIPSVFPPELEAIIQRAEAEDWYRLNVCPSTKEFFGTRLFLVENEQTARLIYTGENYTPVFECLLEPGEFDCVAAAAAAYLKPVAEVELAKVKARRLIDGTDY